MKIQRRVIYTSLLVLCCVLLAWPNTSGHSCDGKHDSTIFKVLSPEKEEPATGLEDIEPLTNLLPSCNLVIH